MEVLPQKGYRDRTILSKSNTSGEGHILGQVEWEDIEQMIITELKEFRGISGKECKRG